MLWLSLAVGVVVEAQMLQTQDPVVVEEAAGIVRLPLKN
jgi:hypothetical protein